ncbi:nitrous oxide reductase accessory protein NosL [Rhodanobacter sp. 115]|jgi:copper chaperone NosL|uniref:nitrous oxide reductase accessory protein NosL n=1 Tax=Rhodanobacter sp. FW021-MT20 TaxID=1162282 RepID=UPI0009DA1899|nr:nitrous oxide reductase accessory protein NosL [Rhodanobacter sp. 115]
MKRHVPHRHREGGRFITLEWLPAVWLVLLLAACSGSRAPPRQAAVDIHKDDVCAVCGMYVSAGPGPRGEAWVHGYKTPLKFGSTRDFFAYVLEPENKARLQQLLVQDSAQINWRHPSNEARTFVDARTAWYVAWQPMSGLMGATFASFATRTDAEAFVHAHGGELLRFSDMTPELVSLLGFECPHPGSPAFALVKACAAAPRSAMPPAATPGEHAEVLQARRSVPGEMGQGKHMPPSMLSGKNPY